MAVYVDRACVEWRGHKWCHLLADSLAELHAFAARLGVRRASFQGHTKYPHYDLPEHLRTEALRLGAIAVGRREIIYAARRLREEHRNNLPGVGSAKPPAP